MSGFVAYLEGFGDHGMLAWGADRKEVLKKGQSRVRFCLTHMGTNYAWRRAKGVETHRVPDELIQLLEVSDGDARPVVHYEWVQKDQTWVVLPGAFEEFTEAECH
jgi:hypothetical protein